MKVQDKPDYLIFASDAQTGELEPFPNIARGWGITIEQTESKPPMEWMNDAFNRVDKNTLYLLQQGVPEWDSAVVYPVDAIIKYQSELYIAINENNNSIPSSHLEKWGKIIPDIKEASTTQKGIVQLSSSIDSDSELTAATAKAIKTVNDKIVPLDNHISIDSYWKETSVWSKDMSHRLTVRDIGHSGSYSQVNQKWQWLFDENGQLVTGTVPVSNITGLGGHVISTYICDDGVSGYRKYSDGWIDQWGYLKGNLDDIMVDITFPITFPTSCLFLSSSIDAWAVPTGAFAMGSVGTIISSSKAKFGIASQASSAWNNSNIKGIFWEAKGR